MDGRISVLPQGRVKAITDEHGTDRTRDVLVLGEEVSVGDSKGAERAAQWRFQWQGPFVTANAGLLEPVGDFGKLARHGYAAGASMHLRTGRHDTWGLRLERSEFRADPSLESALSERSSGAVDELRFQLWTLSVTARYLIAPDRTVAPFLQMSLGVQRKRTVLKGPGVEGSGTDTGLNQDMGAGLDVRLGEGLSGEVAAAYAFGTGEGHAEAGVASVFTSGTIQYFKFQAGLVKRFGS